MANEIKEISRRGPLRFSECGIPIGATLTFVEDSSITVTVVDDRHIHYEGETTSLSALARRLKNFTHQVQGTIWFKYEGEVLNDLRNRLGK